MRAVWWSRNHFVDAVLKARMAGQASRQAAHGLASSQILVPACAGMRIAVSLCTPTEEGGGGKGISRTNF